MTDVMPKDPRPLLAKHTNQGIAVGVFAVLAYACAPLIAYLVGDPNLTGLIQGAAVVIGGAGGLRIAGGIARRIPNPTFTNTNLALALLALPLLVGCATSGHFQTGLNEETKIRVGVDPTAVSLDVGVGALGNEVHGGGTVGMTEDLALKADSRAGGTFNPARLLCTAIMASSHEPGYAGTDFCIWRQGQQEKRQEREAAQP